MTSQNELSEFKKIHLDDGSFGNVFDDELSDKKLNEIMPLLGEIILDFNYLESILDDVITEFIFERSSDLGLTIIAKMSFSQKVDLFKDITIPACKQTGQPKMASKFTTLVKKLKEAGENRNRAIHARWIDADKEFFVRTKIGTDDNGVFGLFFKLDKKTLKKYAREMQKLSDILSDDLYARFIRGMG